MWQTRFSGSDEEQSRGAFLNQQSRGAFVLYSRILLFVILLFEALN
jgi:hypothetical protein